jgi:hypothetical protein
MGDRFFHVLPQAQFSDKQFSRARVYLKSDRQTDRQTADELKKSSSMETKTSGKKVF